MKSIDDIDFQKLWEQARKTRAWSSKGPEDWDKKAASFAARNRKTPYIDLILNRLPLQKEYTILDMGAGPGTLAVPLSSRVSSVTAVDYSKQMLLTLDSFCKAENINNIKTVQCSWTDDWQKHGIEEHDIAIASRSLNVSDLTDALKKINHFARKYVFLVDRISPTPFEPDVFDAINRPFQSGPDYIYTINILYHLGIHPNVEIVQLDKKMQFADFNDILDSFRWMLKDISEEEDKLLQEYIHQKALFKNDGTIEFERQHPPRWAIVWWKKK